MKQRKINGLNDMDSEEPASPSEIAVMDIDVRPDGKGLPTGSGKVETGKNIYALKCAACHGATGSEEVSNRLVAAMGDTVKAKTIGNYWPYATTIFDYVRRTMPYNAPGSLQDNEVYALTAYLLYANKIIDSSMEINANTLPSVVMPAKKFFIPDDRKGGTEDTIRKK